MSEEMTMSLLDGTHEEAELRRLIVEWSGDSGSGTMVRSSITTVSTSITRVPP
jgi:hypothetical protein